MIELETRMIRAEEVATILGISRTVFGNRNIDTWEC